MLKKSGKSLQLAEKALPLHSLSEIGALDEWLSHWSAKPATAVRIRHAPRKALMTMEGRKSVIDMCGQLRFFDKTAKR